MLHRGDDHVLDDTVEAVRMEVERLDFAVIVFDILDTQILTVILRNVKEEAFRQRNLCIKFTWIGKQCRP